MKKIITLLMLTICIQFTKAQMVTIPDANFVTWLQANLPSAMVGNQMDIMDPAVTSRTGIELYNLNISDLTGIQYFTSLDTLNCFLNPITSLPVLSNSVKRINLFGNQLTSLPTLPSSLVYLRCEQNLLTSLPTLPTTLLELYCSDNQLASLPALPNSINNIICEHNQLTSLPTLPSSLTGLYCSYNQITSLPTLPNTITTIFCYYNNLIGLPTLPTSIYELNCSNNLITSIPALPNALVKLYCDHNQLTTLPSISNSLLLLDCSYNNLINLPVLFSPLANLNCSHNNLTTLPNLPVSLWLLDCSYNQLTSLPNLPIDLGVLVCSHNNITCFPVFPNIQSHYVPTVFWPILAFDISANPFTCLPNYVGGMDTVTLNYPLCIPGNTLSNSNGCVTGKGITGSVFHDFNFDCQKNTNELGITNAIVKLYDNTNTYLGLTQAQQNGLYNFSVPTGTYNVVLDTVNKPFIIQCIDPGIDSLVALTFFQTVEDSVDFAIICKPGFDLGVQSINRNGAVFPGVTHTLEVAAGDMTQWNNLSCASGISGTVSFAVNGPVVYLGPSVGALIPTVAGNVYTYNIADFGTVNNVNDFKILLQTNTNAQAWDIICVNATVTPIAGDSNPLNNIYQYCYFVSNSLDPNIKEVYPVEVHQGFNDWLTYTIHFQNTGNAAAINIRLEDELDMKLNTETFEVINYSHDNVIDLSGNHLTVRFPNIQLADSNSNPAGSIGFIQYRIKPKTSWITDTISNTASIYFDYNAPVITNTAKSYFMSITNVNEQFLNSREVNILPNPTNNLLNVASKYDFEKIELTSITGQVLLSESVNAKTHQLQLQNLAEGIYFVKVVYANGMSVTKKVMKQ